MTFSNPIVGGTTLIRPAIRTPNFVAGSAGWSINKDGSAEFNDVTVRGSGTTDALIVGAAASPQVRIGSNANAGFIAFPTNRPIENQRATILAGPLNVGAANEAASLQINGPTVTGATKRASIQVNSQNNDATSNPSVALKADTSTLILDDQIATLTGPRLSVQPAPTASNALAVSADAAHTGNLLSLQKGGTEHFAVNDQIVTVSGPRLSLVPAASGFSAIFVPANAGHTGNLLRLQKGGVDQFVVGNDGTVTTVLKASNRITGKVTITPGVANTPTSAVVTFPVALTGSDFTCQVTVNSVNPGTQVTGVGYSALTNAGVTIWLTRSNAGVATTLSYTVEGF